MSERLRCTDCPKERRLSIDELVDATQSSLIITALFPTSVHGVKLAPPSRPPVVSVIIPLYNHELYIGEAIESVLNSSIKDVEILIVDDGSSDRSVEVVNRFKTPRLKLFTQRNMGAHEAINRGASLSSSPWIAILNSDDRFRGGKLERHLQLHAENPDLEASASRVRYIYENGEPVPAEGYLAWRYSEAKKKYEQSSSLWISLIKTNHLVTTSSLFMKKAILQEIGGIPPLRYNHDWFLFLTLAARKRFEILEEELVDYRRHQANTITEDENRARVESLFVAEWHLHSMFSQRPLSIDMSEAMNAFHARPWVSYRLLLFLALWRQCNDNDLIKACALFSSRDNPTMAQALSLVEEDLGTLRYKMAIKRCLGTKWPRWADKAFKAWKRINRMRFR